MIFQSLINKCGYNKIIIKHLINYYIIEYKFNNAFRAIFFIFNKNTYILIECKRVYIIMRKLIF